MSSHCDCDQSKESRERQIGSLMTELKEVSEELRTQLKFMDSLRAKLLDLDINISRPAWLSEDKSAKS